MQKENENKIVIYKTKSGETEIDVKIGKQTIWLTQKQIAQLFSVNVPAINKHLLNIFTSKELNKKSVISILEITARDGKKYQTNIYNLDAIISVGYRVNSKRATQFRIWATNTLKNYLVDGYTINQKRLIKQVEKFKQLQRAIVFIEKKADNYLLRGKSRELLSLISEYTKSLTILKQYDDGKIKIAKTKKPIYILTYNYCKNLIIEAKAELKRNNEASDLFGCETDNKLDSIIGAVYQTFGSKELYRGIEEKAAHLLYLIIKDHPFSDGNKRIASLIFVYFLDKNDYLYKNNYEKKISNSALVSLALLIATSDPKDKKIMITIIISLLQEK